LYLCDIQTYQAVKDVSASYDALVDLLESIGHFLSRLDIYTKITPTAAMAEIIVKIMVELLSTLALVTKEVKQKRASESDLVDYPVDLKAAQ
jgi:F420-0:gamma-glutamyl ligase-like protein